MSFLKTLPNHTILHLKVTPNSSETKFGEKISDEKNQEYLKVNLAAVPTDGKANEELIKFLAKTLKISKSKIEIIRGETSRMKVVRITEKVDGKFDHLTKPQS